MDDFEDDDGHDVAFTAAASDFLVEAEREIEALEGLAAARRVLHGLGLEIELQGLGHRFRTVSDAEVLVHAYQAYGPECVSRLDGMFAFAIWDAARRTLVLARDRMGRNLCTTLPEPTHSYSVPSFAPYSSIRRCRAS